MNFFGGLRRLSLLSDGPLRSPGHFQGVANCDYLGRKDHFGGGLWLCFRLLREGYLAGECLLDGVGDGADFGRELCSVVGVAREERR